MCTYKASVINSSTEGFSNRQNEHRSITNLCVLVSSRFNNSVKYFLVQKSVNVWRHLRLPNVEIIVMPLRYLQSLECKPEHLTGSGCHAQ
jgi:hypothetical protein